MDNSVTGSIFNACFMADVVEALKNGMRFRFDLVNDKGMNQEAVAVSFWDKKEGQWDYNGVLMEELSHVENTLMIIQSETPALLMELLRESVPDLNSDLVEIRNLRDEPAAHYSGGDQPLTLTAQNTVH